MDLGVAWANLVQSRWHCQVLAQAARGQEDLLVVDCDLTACQQSPAQQMFHRDRRPELYPRWLDR